ncbi:MAG TPA: exonuclease [Sphingobacterium sp.]|nr:exonuclease [Sphingobacterium sp.]
MPQILQDFLVAKPEGYYCRYGDFYIDPLLPVDKAVVSHAHGDHARPGHRQIFASNGTVAFMRHRFPKQLHSSYAVVPFYTVFFIGGVELSFVPAGHILGSAQIFMKYQGTTYLYTGDIKSQADPTCEPLEILSADVLITETTFANPDTVHPNPVEEIRKLSATSHNIMLGCYGLGKAQRITYLINRYCPEKIVYVHHNILRLHRLYDEIGLVPLQYEIYHRSVMKAGHHKVYLVPPITFNNYYRATNVLRVFASGWQRLQRHNDMELYISDHVDWNDLLGFVAAVSPQEIWTVHGDGRLLAQHFEGQIKVRDIV